MLLQNGPAKEDMMSNASLPHPCEEFLGKSVFDIATMSIDWGWTLTIPASTAVSDLTFLLNKNV
jgi:hypothetical protein